MVSAVSMGCRSGALTRNFGTDRASAGRGGSAGWARGRLHDAAAGAEDLRRVLADRVDQGARYDAWFYSALARIEEAMALARQVENRCNLAFPHLLRSELLLKRDPSNSSPAEQSFRTALAIAKEQGARSWGLRAALSLAKLYQSTKRPIEARAVLGPALEGGIVTLAKNSGFCAVASTPPK